MTISLVFQGVSWTSFTNSTPFAWRWAAKSAMPLVLKVEVEVFAFVKHTGWKGLSHQQAQVEELTPHSDACVEILVVELTENPVVFQRKWHIG